MSDEVMLALVGFFSLVVSAMTATIGYFKVWLPSKKPVESNGKSQTVSAWIKELEGRCKFLETRCEKLQEETEKCHRDRAQLTKDKFDLLTENRELRKRAKGN